MSLITQSDKYITSENLIIESIKSILICIILFLCMANGNKTAKNKLVQDQDEPVLRLRSTLVSVQDTPTRKIIYACLKSVQDEPMIWRRSTLVSVQDDEPMIWRRSTLVLVQDTPTRENNSPSSLEQQIDLRNNKECTVCKKELKKEVIPRLTKKISLVIPITLEPYSEKSFVVRGDTFDHKDKLAELGGKWNKFLRDKQTDSLFGAWIFSNSKKFAVQEFLRLQN